MSRAGARAARREREIAGIAICSLVAELPQSPIEGATEVPCARCDRLCSVTPSTATLLAAGWVCVCTHDAGRYRHVLGQQVIAPHARDEFASRLEAFAQERGIAADVVTVYLPPELGWLHEKGVAL